MKSVICVHRFSVVFAALALAMVASGEGAAHSKLDQQLKSAIAKVRRSHSGPDQLKAAERLVTITYNRDCSSVADSTIHSLVSLLDVQDDGVQMWVAAALGEFGVRAKEAAPKLLAIYSMSACTVQDRGSAATIPTALKNMGVSVPKPNCIPK